MKIYSYCIKLRSGGCVEEKNGRWKAKMGETTPDANGNDKNNLWVLHFFCQRTVFAIAYLFKFCFIIGVDSGETT